MTNIIQYWDGEKWQHENVVEPQGKIQAPASVAEAASLNIPVGVEPTSPIIGDIWQTTNGLYYRNNAGATIGPLVSNSIVDHGLLSGLSDDDHPQYGGIAQDESVSGIWTFTTSKIKVGQTTLAQGVNGTITFPASAGTLELVGHTHSYQPIDADLTAIAALAGTSGLLRKTAADTWSLDTNTYLTGNQSITLSGDVSGSGTTSISVTVSDDSHSHTGTTISSLDASDTTTGTFDVLRIPATAFNWQSGSDFADGTLVTTSIDATPTSGLSFVIEVTGKSYTTTVPPFAFMAQGYLYTDTIINYSGVDLTGAGPSYIKIMNNGGFLAFWWPRVSYWNSFSVHVRDASSANGRSTNLVTNIENSVDPVAATKKVTVNLVKTWNSYTDGAGSTLDADLLDGQQGSYYATDSAVVHLAGTETVSGAKTFSLGSTQNSIRVGVTAAGEIDTSAGNLTIDSAGGTVTVDDNLTVSGNLTVNGTTITANSTTVTIDDPIFTLGGDTAPTVDDNKDRGIEFRWHNGSVAKVGFFGYDDSTGSFTFIPDATNTSEVFSGTKGTIDAYLSGSNINAGTVSATYIDSAIARLAGPTFTGTPAAPTAGRSTSSTQIATTAFVKSMFGGTSTSGVLDWNDASNARAGLGDTLLMGNATNGPGPAAYFHALNFEYASTDGTGNITQFAIPYASPTTDIWMRGRYSAAWGSWVKIYTSANLSPATDSLVVHLAGAETITGAKTFSMANAAAVNVRANSSSSATPWIEVVGQRSDGNASASFSGQIGLGAVRTDTWAASGKVVGRIAFGQPTTFGDMNTIQYAASIVGYADGVPTGASNPTGLKFYTGSTPVGINAANVNAGTLALTIDSAGAATFAGTVNVPTLDLTTAATATAATSYWVETGSDGIVRPKTLANVKAELVVASEVLTKLLTVDGSGSSLDADLLDGQHLTDFVVTRATVVSTNSTDFNTIVTAGTYQVSGNGTWTGSSNGPTSAYAYGQLVVTVNGNIVTQAYYVHQATGHWIRSKFNASDWQGWQRIWTDANDGSSSGLDADLLDGQHGSYYQTPVGTITAYAGSSAPTNWLLCDGAAVSRTTYAALFAVISTTYGAGDGSTTFNLPNIKGKVPVGLDSAQTEFDALNEQGGSKTSTAPHTHAVDHDHASFNATSGGHSADHTHAGNTGNVSAWHQHSGNTGNVSSDHVHWDYDGDLGAGGSGLVRKGYAVNGDATSGFHANHTHAFGTGDPNANHYHGYTTGGASVGHTHTTTVDVPAFTGTSGASSAAAASGNLPPYIVVNYIIRAL